MFVIPVATVRSEPKGKPKWKCRICSTLKDDLNSSSFIFQTKQEYDNHINESHEGKAYHCHLCKYSNKIKHNLVTHLYWSHKIKCKGGLDFERFRCKHPGCNFRAKDRWSVGKHISKSHLKLKMESLDCSECSLTFSGSKEYEGHMIDVHDRIPENAAALAFISPSLLHQNKAKHLSKDPLGSKVKMQCEHCGLVASNRSHLNAHMASKHPQDTDYNPLALSEDEYLCGDCGKTVHGKMNFAAHRSWHKNYKKNPCPDCGKGFTTRNELETHRAKRHGALQPCRDCGPDASEVKYTVADLREHIYQTHRDSKLRDRTFCPVEGCRQVTRTKGEVIDHFRYKHMRYLTFRCKLCNKRFGDFSTTKYHILWVHEKKKKMSDLDPLYFDDPDLFENYALTDPSYPTSEVVEAEMDRYLGGSAESVVVTVEEVQTEA